MLSPHGRASMPAQPHSRTTQRKTSRQTFFKKLSPPWLTRLIVACRTISRCGMGQSEYGVTSMKYRAFIDGHFTGPVFETKNAAAQYVAALHRHMDFNADEEEVRLSAEEFRTWDVYGTTRDAWDYLGQVLEL